MFGEAGLVSGWTQRIDGAPVLFPTSSYGNASREYMGIFWRIEGLLTMVLVNENKPGGTITDEIPSDRRL